METLSCLNAPIYKSTRDRRRTGVVNNNCTSRIYLTADRKWKLPCHSKSSLVHQQLLFHCLLFFHNFSFFLSVLNYSRPRSDRYRANEGGNELNEAFKNEQQKTYLWDEKNYIVAASLINSVCSMCG